MTGRLDWMNQLVDLQRGKNTDNSPPTNRRYLTITAVSPSTGTVSVQYPTGTVVAGVAYLAAATPAVGDKVLVLETGADAVVVDSLVSAAGSGTTGLCAFTRGTTAPSGWLIRNGGAIPSQYTALIALVGANTPDDRDKTVIGSGSTYTNGTAYNVAASGSSLSARGLLPIIKG